MTDRFTARFRTTSARATQTLGVRLGKALAPGDVVALVGELGAGKTQLVRGACDGAAVPPEEVSSPSFAIVASYRGRIPVHHADLYRIGDEDELYGTGFGDLVGGEGALLVEWADRIPGALPEEKLTVRLSHDARAPNVRHVALLGVGERHAALARALVARRRDTPSPPAGARREGGVSVARKRDTPSPPAGARREGGVSVARKRDTPSPPAGAGGEGGVRGRSRSTSTSKSKSRSKSRSRSRSR